MARTSKNIFDLAPIVSGTSYSDDVPDTTAIGLDTQTSQTYQHITIERFGNNGIYGDTIVTCLFDDIYINDITNNDGITFHVGAGTGNRIARCYIKACGENAIDIQTGHDSTLITKVQAEDCIQSGLVINGSDNVVMKCNSINSGYSGYLIKGVDSILIDSYAYNCSKTNDNFGVKIEGTGVIINGNNFVSGPDSTGHAVTLADGSTGGMMKGNVITANGDQFYVVVETAADLAAWDMDNNIYTGSTKASPFYISDLATSYTFKQWFDVYGLDDNSTVDGAAHG